MECFRNVFYDFRFPALSDLLLIGVIGAVTLVLGYLVFRRYEGRLAEEL